MQHISRLALTLHLSVLLLTTEHINAIASEQIGNLPLFYRSLQIHRPSGLLGAVIKKEQIETDIPNATAWRIAYNSSDLFDRPTISTAIVVAPKGKSPKDGRPILAWAHGTTGTAQNCGPSQVQNPAQQLNQYFLVGGNSWTDYGIPAVNEFIQQGYIVVATDYQGLGGGGKHQYVVSKTQGRDAINSIRAVGSMNIGGNGNKSVIYGWSQGGGTTLAAASMPDYISKKGTAFDKINIVGFVAMAPPDISVLASNRDMNADEANKLLDKFISSFTDNVFNFAHLSMNLWANTAAFPNLKLTDIYTEEGANIINNVMQNKCVHVVSDTLNFTVGQNYKSLLKPKPDNTLVWAKALIEGGIPLERPVAPVMIYWGEKDTVVPPIMGELYKEKMCKIGANVSRVKLSGQQNHFTTPMASQPLYLRWIADRINGLEAENGCLSENKG